MSAALQLATPLSPLTVSVFTEAAQVLKPPPQLSISAWAEANFVLSSEDSAIVGQYRTDLAPFQAEMLDSIGEPGVYEVTFQCASQLAKTVVFKIWIAYFMREDPSSMLFLLPDLELAKRVSRQRLAPMFRDVPVLKGLLEQGARKSGNSTLEKSFPGGVLFLVGSNSPAALSSMPVRIVLADEVNRFAPSAGAEGSPLDLAHKRIKNFWNRKFAKASTPTDEHGVITVEYEQSDMRRFYVPCPHCTDEADLVHYRDREGWDAVCRRHNGPPAGYQTLDFKRLIIDKEWPQSGSVYYACSHCAVALSELDKPFMLRHGHWVAQHPEIISHRGYHLNGLYSPFSPWEEIAADWRKCMDHREDKNKLQVFVNTVLAEPYTDDTESLDSDELNGRVEDYPCPAPDGVTVITAAVDVQVDRLEFLARGWGKGQESWIVDRKIFEGDTSTLGEETVKPTDPEAVPFKRPGPWQRLDEYLQRAFYLHARGVRLPIACTFIDSGDQTQVVYEFVKSRASRWIYASKGMSNSFGKPPLGQFTRNNAARVRLYPIAVDVIKMLIYRRLKIGTPGAGYLHFSRPLCDSDYFKQLTAEQLKRKLVRGYWLRFWEKLSGRRNEALDLEVYAYAAFLRLSENPEEMLEKQREALLERAKFAAAARRAKVDPNQLSLLALPVAPPETEAEPAAPATDAASLSPVAVVPSVSDVSGDNTGNGKREAGNDLGVHEYKVAEKLDQDDCDPEPPPAPVVRVRRSGWI